MPIDFPVFPLSTPCLRPVELIPVRSRDGQPAIMVRDPLGVIEGTAVLSANPLLMVFLELANGENTIEQIVSAVTRATGEIVPAQIFESMTQQLDQVLLLQTERFREAFEAKKAAFAASDVRAPLVFASDEKTDRLAVIKELSDELRRHGAGTQGPPSDLGLPRASVRAILSPHIDYARGGHGYAWAYRALKEAGTPAKTYIVLGTHHHGADHPFIATRKHYETPLGRVETNIALLDEFAAEFKGELFADEYAHAGEHTIELQAVYLRHIFGAQAPSIVPILVGSFENLLHDGRTPKDDPEIVAFCAALRTVLDRHPEVGLIGGVDFSHCGPQFGDVEPVDANRKKEIEACDRRVLDALESGDPEAFFEAFREDLNAQNVCSIAPIYCVMEAMRDRAKPRVLHYDAHNSTDGSCLVSFAAAAFVQAPSLII